MLFILKDERSSILAISESQLDLQQYIAQYHKYFDGRKYTVYGVDDSRTISKMMIDYSELFLQPFVNEVYLTEMEYTFYNNILRDIYDDMGRLVTLLDNITQGMVITTPEFKEYTHQSARLIEELALLPYDDFITSLNNQFIINNVLEDPILVKNSYAEVIEMKRLIKNKIIGGVYNG